ncbi:AraC family transcriptional regulator ligand-binding domain-containing protein [Shimia sp. R9_2]|nr:AraC family transcriptional regulator ligand-binding domain-containing protein [Shimia sp. R9_2]
MSYLDISDPKALHTTDQEIKAIQNLIALAPRDVGLGWSMGREMHVNAFGIWGFAILTSPTLRMAIEVAIAYARLSTIVAAISFEEGQRQAFLTFDMEGLPKDVHRFLFERHTAVAVNFISELFQGASAIDFEIQTQETDRTYAAELSLISNIPVSTGGDTNSLLFPVAILDQPLAKSDPASLRFCLDQCKMLSDQPDDDVSPWSEKVKNEILTNVSHDHKIEEISSRLTVTERTLRRRLTEEGTSFRELYTDVRMALAYELLETTGLNVETVSWRVGYSEAASFARAFTKKYGKAPSAVRNDGVGRVA